MTSLFFAIVIAAFAVFGIVKIARSKREGATVKLCVISLCLLFLCVAASLFMDFKNPI